MADEDSHAIGNASQWRLTWEKFRDHRLAFWSGVVIILIYLTESCVSEVRSSTASSRRRLPC
ncbi:hypothetical protein [Martelella soudanensis]|nr:hypothetical protein [Martelella sp. NC20]